MASLMFTPTLNPDSSSSIKTNTNSTSSISQNNIELGKILRKHDPNAIRLYDFINHVKVFLYNSYENRWEKDSYIEGNLFFYERKQIIHNHSYTSYAFAVINSKQNFIQQITSDMSEQTDKLFLFYEVIKNDKPEVFCLYFLNENECLRLHSFINQSIQSIRNFKEKQSFISTTGKLQSRQTNRHVTPPNTPNSITDQFESSQQTLTPITNDNTEDSTSSLKRLLNIPSQNSFDNISIFSQQQNPITLIPPSAFESILVTPSSPIGAEHKKHDLSQIHPSIDRAHIRNVFINLIQTNDHFNNIILQACLNHRS